MTEQEQIQGKGMSQDLKSTAFQLIEFCKYVKIIKVCTTKTESSDIFIPLNLLFFIKKCLNSFGKWQRILKLIFKYI